MTELGTLHTFPHAATDRSADAQPLRSDDLLDVRPAPPEIAPVGGLQSLRLGAELALRSRWPFMATMLAAALVALPGLLSQHEWGQQSGYGVLAMLVFAFGLIRGIDGRSKDRAFWTGLGARPASLELGVIIVDLVALGLLCALGLMIDGSGSFNLIVGTIAALIMYGFGSATRSAASAELGRFGLMLLMGVVVLLNTLVAFFFSYGHLLFGIGIQLGIVTAAGIAARVLMSGRAPESAAGRGQRRWSWLGCSLAGLLVVPVQFMQGVPWYSVAGPEIAGLMLPTNDPLAGMQIWRRSADGSAERLSLRGRLHHIEAGPSGAAAFNRKSIVSLAQTLYTMESEGTTNQIVPRGFGSRFGILTADGNHIECDAPLLEGSTAFDADGMGATRTLSTGERWRLDADGCRRTDTGGEG